MDGNEAGARVEARSLLCFFLSFVLSLSLSVFVGVRFFQMILDWLGLQLTARLGETLRLWHVISTPTPSRNGRSQVAEVKESPEDFVLWKSAKPSEPSWASPWGSGVSAEE